MQQSQTASRTDDNPGMFVFLEFLILRFLAENLPDHN